MKGGSSNTSMPTKLPSNDTYGFTCGNSPQSEASCSMVIIVVNKMQ